MSNLFGIKTKNLQYCLPSFSPSGRQCKEISPVVKFDLEFQREKNQYNCIASAGTAVTVAAATLPGPLRYCSSAALPCQLLQPNCRTALSKKCISWQTELYRGLQWGMIILMKYQSGLAGPQSRTHDFTLITGSLTGGNTNIFNATIFRKYF